MSAYRWFENKKIKAFYNSVCAPTFRIGVQVLLQVKSFLNTVKFRYKDRPKLRPPSLLRPLDPVFSANWFH